jgi:hypothetical protein
MSYEEIMADVTSNMGKEDLGASTDGNESTDDDQDDDDWCDDIADMKAHCCTKLDDTSQFGDYVSLSFNL